MWPGGRKMPRSGLGYTAHFLFVLLHLFIYLFFYLFSFFFFFFFSVFVCLFWCLFVVFCGVFWGGGGGWVFFFGVCLLVCFGVCGVLGFF